MSLELFRNGPLCRHDASTHFEWEGAGEATTHLVPWCRVSERSARRHVPSPQEVTEHDLACAWGEARNSSCCTCSEGIGVDCGGRKGRSEPSKGSTL